MPPMEKRMPGGGGSGSGDILAQSLMRLQAGGGGLPVGPGPRGYMERPSMDGLIRNAVTDAKDMGRGVYNIFDLLKQQVERDFSVR